MIQDLHSHTYYSFCGKDNPDAVARAALDGGIELLGICDHNYGIGLCRRDARYAPEEIVPNAYEDRTLRKYFDHLTLLRDQYAGRLKILRGIEVCTHPGITKGVLPDSADISYFDYCLIESLDAEDSITGGDLFAFAARCGCPCAGIAHTDLFAFLEKIGADPLEYLRKMADANIFWELNVNFDSIHHYRAHPYVAEFFENKHQQALVKASGVRLSVGFDGHRVEDYQPRRVKEACLRLSMLGIPMAFE